MFKQGRSHPGYEFGGRLMLENVDRFMKLNLPTVPPIEVSLVYPIQILC